MALAPCHALFQFYVADGKLVLPALPAQRRPVPRRPVQHRQLRAAHPDGGRPGRPRPGDFIWVGGDCHIYSNHPDQVREQLSARCYLFPALLAPAQSLFDYTYEHFTVRDYQHHPAMRAPWRCEGARGGPDRGGHRRDGLGPGPDGVIGADGGLPWHLPEDLKLFSSSRPARPESMGRRTWESLPERFRPLPGRTNVVLTSDPGGRPGGATGGLGGGGAHRAPPLWVIGGGAVYGAFLRRTPTGWWSPTSTCSSRVTPGRRRSGRLGAGGADAGRGRSPFVVRSAVRGHGVRTGPSPSPLGRFYA